MVSGMGLKPHCRDRHGINTYKASCVSGLSWLVSPSVFRSSLSSPIFKGSSQIVSYAGADSTGKQSLPRLQPLQLFPPPPWFHCSPGNPALTLSCTTLLDINRGCFQYSQDAWVVDRSQGSEGEQPNHSVSPPTNKDQSAMGSAVAGPPVMQGSSCLPLRQPAGILHPGTGRPCPAAGL